MTVTFTTLATFNGADGATPNGPLLIDSAGNLVGTTWEGGASNNGTLFELAANGSGYASTPTVLATLTESQTGGLPYDGLIADSSGNLFATIYGGGPGSYGTVVELVKAGTGYAGAVTILANFNGTNGGFLNSGLIMDAKGDLFGSSWAGGTNGAGNIFEIVKTASGYTSGATVIATFNGTDGQYPNGLVADANGDLFGTTLKGGANGSGTVFEIAKTATGYSSTPITLATLSYAIGGNSDSPLIMDASGDLFGVTQTGGTHGSGVLFEIAKTTSGYAAAPTILINFDNATTGAVPSGTLLIDAAGDLFGEASQGGPSGYGVIFKLAKTATGYAAAPTILETFNGTNGAFPAGGLTVDAQGDLLGVAAPRNNFTTVAGAPPDGSIFELTGAGYTLLAAQTVSQAETWYAASHTGSVVVQDSATNVTANLGALETMAAAGTLSSIALTDSGTPNLSLSSSNFLADLPALSAISTPVQITLTDNGPISVSAAELAANLGVFAELSGSQSIQLTDSGIPTLSLSPAQLANYGSVLGTISSSFTVSVTAPASSVAIAGLAGHGTTVILSGTAASWTATASGDDTSFTLTNGTITDHLSGITALQFSDHTDFVASTTPTTAGAVSSAEVANLYAGVFARTPDTPGLAYYEAQAAANPSRTITSFAESFLSSPEYTNAHSYAQSSAGDAQFITDTYQNLLHRAPGSTDVAWYQANVINPILGTAAPGTAAYTQAELLAHAAVLADFSQSAEFLNNVQITAQHPADATHWLVLV